MLVEHPACEQGCSEACRLATNNLCGVFADWHSQSAKMPQNEVCREKALRNRSPFDTRADPWVVTMNTAPPAYRAAVSISSRAWSDLNFLMWRSRDGAFSTIGSGKVTCCTSLKRKCRDSVETIDLDFNSTRPLERYTNVKIKDELHWFVDKSNCWLYTHNREKVNKQKFIWVCNAKEPHTVRSQNLIYFCFKSTTLLSNIGMLTHHQYAWCLWEAKQFSRPHLNRPMN